MAGMSLVVLAVGGMGPGDLASSVLSSQPCSVLSAPRPGVVQMRPLSGQPTTKEPASVSLVTFWPRSESKKSMRKKLIMKIRTIILMTALLVAAPLYAREKTDVL